MPQEKLLTEADLKDLSMDELLSMFVEQLIIDKGVEATDELREELLSEISDRMNERILGKLSDEDKKKLDEMLSDENTPDEEIDKFIMGAGVDMDAEIAEVLKAFHDEYLGEEA